MLGHRRQRQTQANAGSAMVVVAVACLLLTGCGYFTRSQLPDPQAVETYRPTLSPSPRPNEPRNNSQVVVQQTRPPIATGIFSPLYPDLAPVARPDSASPIASPAQPAQTTLPTPDESVATGPLDAGPIAPGLNRFPSPPISSLNPSRRIVGILLPLSGQHGVLGRRMLESAQFALTDIAPDAFELLVADSTGTPAGAYTGVISLLSRGAELILGPLLSPSVAAAAPVAQSHSINLITFTTDRSQARPGVYVMGFLPRAEIERITSYLSSQGIRRLGLFAPNNTYGRVIHEELRRAAGLYGALVTAVGFYHPKSRNYAESVRSFAANRAALPPPPSTNTTAPLPLPSDESKKPTRVLPQFDFDAVILPASGNPLREIAALLSYHDVTPDIVRFVGTGLWDEEGIGAEPSLNGGWYVAPDPKNRRRFQSRFQSMFGSLPPRLATLSYDATALAIALAATPNATASEHFTRAAITSSDGFLGLDGAFRFLPDGVVERRLAILAAGADKPTIVDPPVQTFQILAN